MKSRILVTGGAGFIGSHLTKLLVSRGHDVTVVDDLSMGLRANVPADARFVQADIRDEDRMLAVVRENRIERVCHLAAKVSIRASVDSFTEDAQINVMGTLSVLKAVCRTDVSNMVFASSMAVYADKSQPEPISEEYLTKPISPYGVSKLAGENFVSNIMALSGRQATVLRLFNTYGPGQTYTPYVGVMTIFATKLLQGQSPVIFGDGNQIRDFVYVGDIAQAFCKAVEREGASGIYNAGSGQPRSVKEIAELLQSRIAPEIPLKFGPAQAGEIRNSIANIARAKADLGYSPQGKLERDVDQVIDAVRERVAMRAELAGAGKQ